MDITHETVGVNPKYEKKVTVNIEKIMDEDKSPKECCVDSIMHDIDGLGNGKQVRSLREAIEQQIRRAWNGGYCTGVREGSEHPPVALSGIIWFMMQTVAEYNADELQAAFGYDHLADAIERLTYNEFCDMYMDYEDRKREEAKEIRVGDEVEVDTDSPWCSGVCYGWVVDIHRDAVKILISTQYGIEMRYKGLGCCRKTGNTAEHLAELIKAMKEER